MPPLQCIACKDELPPRAQVCQQCGQSVPRTPVQRYGMLAMWVLLLLIFAAIYAVLKPAP